jgi:Ca-activated chloride channel family protein
MTFALARPQSTVNLPRVEGTVILVFDVSGSMSANDIQPTRMEAARSAALGFVDRQPSTVQVGIVAFSDGGLSVMPPTNEKADIIAAINRLSPQRGTSLASGIHSGLELISRSTGQQGELSDSAASATPVPAAPAVGGPSGVIVLLTDGENNMSPDPFEAAQSASAANVRIDTIGIGSPQGVTLEINGYVVHTQLDEETLQQISRISGGTYFNARNEEDLRRIYEGIHPRLVMKEEDIEVTSLFTGLGMLLLLLGGALSLLWFGRAP